MLDHVSIPVGGFERSARFYDAALAPLGLVRIRMPELDGVRIADYGVGDVLSFSVGAPMEAPPGAWTVQPLLGMHIAFEAPTRPSVDAFHAECSTSRHVQLPLGTKPLYRHARPGRGTTRP